MSFSSILIVQFNHGLKMRQTGGITLASHKRTDECAILSLVGSAEQ